MKNKLYVWSDTVDSIPPLPLDHTWVSSYKPNDSSPTVDKGNYWYCWGDARDSAMLLGEGYGGEDFARNIAKPHDKKANVGIVYLKDGVCHQMANRLLRFSFDSNNEVVTVKGAKGYHMSKGMYGTYGEKRQRTQLQKERIKEWEDAVSSYQLHMSNDDE
jgi:hypothetical protein